MNSNEEFTLLEQAINCLRVNDYNIKDLSQITKNSLIKVLADNKALFTTKKTGKVSKVSVKSYISNYNKDCPTGC